MTVTVTRLNNEPIIIATLSGIVTATMVKEVFRLSTELMGDEDCTFHRITDVRNADSNFMEMMGVIKEAATRAPGSTTDPRIRTTFVGTTTWMTFFRNALQNPQFGGKSLAAFTDIDDALASVRFQLQNEKSSSIS